jgi:hypothetical protein
MRRCEWSYVTAQGKFCKSEQIQTKGLSWTEFWRIFYRTRKKGLDFRKSLNLIAIPINDIIPDRKWANSKIISIHPRIRTYYIKRTIYNHLFIRFRVFRNTDYFIGMITSSCGLIMTPMGMWERYLHKKYYFANTALILLTPELLDSSFWILNTPISLEFSTWGPPQSSRE